MKNMNRQFGMTLIEIMIALLIGAFMLGGLLTSFVSSKATNTMLENMGRVQENGRYALDILANHIRMARYTGCQSLDVVTPNIIPDGTGAPAIPALTLASAFSGVDNVSANWNANACGGNCSPGSDAFSVVFAENCGGNLTVAMANPDSPISFQGSCSISSSGTDALLVSDCVKTDIFRPTNQASPIQHPTLSKAYDLLGEVSMYRSYVYFIRTSTSNNGTSLWRRDNTKANTGNPNAELVESIDDMQILYGEDTNNDGTANYYVSASQVVNWANVVSARISVLVSSLDRVSNFDPNSNNIPTYVWNGNTIPNTDGRLRKVFSTTVTIRN